MESHIVAQHLRADEARVNLPSGLSPSVVELHHISPLLEAEGSRTVTAGSDLHRPRYTREFSTRRAHFTPTCQDLSSLWPAETLQVGERRSEGYAEEGVADTSDQRRCFSIVTVDRHRGSCPGVHRSQRSRCIKIMSKGRTHPGQYVVGI